MTALDEAIAKADEALADVASEAVAKESPTWRHDVAESAGKRAARARVREPDLARALKAVAEALEEVRSSATRILDINRGNAPEWEGRVHAVSTILAAIERRLSPGGADGCGTYAASEPGQSPELVNSSGGRLTRKDEP